MSSASRDDARPISEPRNGGVNARRWKRITYSREFLLAVGSAICKNLPAGIDASKHPDDHAGKQRARGVTEPAESYRTGVRTSSKPCTKFFSTAGCSFGENCHFIHNFPGGYHAVANVRVLQDDPAPVRAPGPPTPTVKPARPCHSAHEESELGIGKQHMSRDNSTPPLMDQRPAGHRAPPLTTLNPGTATPAAASFGASSTAKISVDASLAGAIIRRDEANIKEISRASGAKLRIMDHESDPGLKNLELEGTFDQIKDATSMVTGMLIAVGGGDAPPPAGGSLRGGGQFSGSFKTKLCGHFARGFCTFGDRCHFAHGESELRTRDHELDLCLKNLELEGTADQIKDTGSTVIGSSNAPPSAGGLTYGEGQRNSFKTKLCGHFARGSCSFGDGCRFAHGESELRIGGQVLDLDTRFKNVELGRAFDQIRDASSMVIGMLIRVGGGDAPPWAGGSLHDGRQWHSFKSKLCGHFAKGACIHGDRCHFAHGESELRKPAAAAARDPRGW